MLALTSPEEAGITATEQLVWLIRRYLDRNSERRLRTLQHRVRQSRSVMARRLAYASDEQSEMIEADCGDIGPVGVN